MFVPSQQNLTSQTNIPRYNPQGLSQVNYRNQNPYYQNYNQIPNPIASSSNLNLQQTRSSKKLAIYLDPKWKEYYPTINYNFSNPILTYDYIENVNNPPLKDLADAVFIQIANNLRLFNPPSFIMVFDLMRRKSFIGSSSIDKKQLIKYLYPGDALAPVSNTLTLNDIINNYRIDFNDSFIGDILKIYIAPSLCGYSGYLITHSK